MGTTRKPRVQADESELTHLTFGPHIQLWPDVTDGYFAEVTYVSPKTHQTFIVTASSNKKEVLAETELDLWLEAITLQAAELLRPVQRKQAAPAPQVPDWLPPADSGELDYVAFSFNLADAHAIQGPYVLVFGLRRCLQVNHNDSYNVPGGSCSITFTAEDGSFHGDLFNGAGVVVTKDVNTTANDGINAQEKLPTTGTVQATCVQIQGRGCYRLRGSVDNRTAVARPHPCG